MKRSDITEVITAFFNPFCWQTDTICRVQQNPDGTWTARLEDVQGNTSTSTEESKLEAIDTAKKQLDLSRTGEMKLLEKNREYSVDEVIAFCINSGRDKLGRHIRDHRPLWPFIWDGASGFPDTIGGINTDQATIWHDIAYWSGLPGDRRARCVADHQLAIDVIELCGASAELANVLYHGPRVGGSGYLPTPWRWGFGR